ncbi:MAG: K(+)/H(+) antiporter NhaP2 [Planctomycetes bacterium ADurb.Bin126]|nr:MAG: K(+)/H(+) antiporter NhaP2 [Planctomycetes bacterium ADurb.Bin126]
MIPTHYILLGLAILLLLSVLASKASERLGVPALLMFLLIGMIAGSEGPGGIYFDDAAVAMFVGTLALAFILFSGGLDTNWQMIRPVLGHGIALATLGVVLTAVAVGLFAMPVLGFSLQEGLLLGAVMSSTDAAAVFAVMRSRKVSMKGRLKPLLELESGSNDPMAVFLTMAAIGLVNRQDLSWWLVALRFLVQMGLGAAVGLTLGWLTTKAFNRLRLEYEGLYQVTGIGIVLLIFGVAEAIGGNGFLAVYITGIILGNSDFLHKRGLTRFHDGLGWLMQIAMFLVLGLLVFPSHVAAVAGAGVLVAGFLMLVARPVAVFLTLSASRMSLREKALVSWVGLRGAVPIVLATFPMMAGVARSDLIFNLVFFVVIASALFQGKTLMLLARLLKLDGPLPDKPKYPLQFDKTEHTLSEMREIDVPAGSPAAGRPISDLKLPPGSLILLVNRTKEFLVPSGTTVIQENDTLLILGEPDMFAQIHVRLQATRQ